MDPVAVVSAAAAVIALTLAALVAHRGLGESTRPLLVVLIAEGILQALTFAVFGGFGDEVNNWVFPLLMVTAAVLAASYLAVVAGLATPLVRPLRQPHMVALLAVLIVAPVAIVAVAGAYIAITHGSEAVQDSVAIVLAILWLLVWMLVSSVFGLVAAISALRRAPLGSAARRRASAFVGAFGARDSIFVLGALLALADEGLGRPTERMGEFAFPLATLMFVPLLAYGILRTQLFDIDLKIKLGIQRGTVVSVILVVVFVAAKAVETYLSRSVGVVAGSLVAGALLFFVPRLNKIGERVANSAMPQVQPTPGYVQFKKLEVYRAAVESALEEGGIGAKEQAMLHRLQQKLALDPADASAVEAEARSAVVPASAPAA